MKKRLISSILSFMVVCSIYSGSVQASEKTSDVKTEAVSLFEKNKDKKNYKEDELIVKFKSSDSEASIQSIKSKDKVKLKKSSKNGISTVSFDSSKHSMSDILKELNSDPNIEFAEPNYIVKLQESPVNEPEFNKLWGLKNTVKSGIDINVEPLWDSLAVDANVVVGVVDSGVDYNHEDLRNNMWVNTQENPYNGYDDDGNGYVDDYYGWDFYNNDPYPLDDNGHGTHVSGTIAAENNGVGISGVAPKVKIMALKVSNSSGNIYKADVIDAINYGASKGVKIFNCSYGGAGYSIGEYYAMRDSNALFLAAAGNDSVNNDYSPAYPANYQLDNILSVASIDVNGNLSDFSNYGRTTIDIAAPGTYIYSTIPGGYDYKSGTSMATPHVTGAAALVLSANSSLLPADIKNYILNSTHKLKALSDKVNTGAILDAAGAVALANSNFYAGVEGIYLSESSIELTKGAKGQLNATVYPSNATNKWISWQSSDESVAAVDSNGRVAAKGAGSAVITATTADGNKTATCSVTVTKPEVKVYYSGDSFTFKLYTPEILGDSGLVYFIKPDGTEEYYSLKLNVLEGFYYKEFEVSDDGYTSYGEIDPKSDYGTWEVRYAAISKDSGYNYYYNEKYYSINDDNYQTANFDSSKFTVAGPDGVIIDNTDDLTNNSMVPTTNNATVFQRAEITNSELYLGSKALIKLYAKDTSGIDDGLIYYIRPDGTEQYTALHSNPRGGYYYAEVEVNNNDYIYSWEIDASKYAGTWQIRKVALSDVNGNYTYYNNEKYFTTQRANFEGAKFNVINSSKNVESITLNTTSAELQVGQSVSLIATVTPSDATNKDVTWSSSNSSVASVDSKGKVTARGSGTATITVTTVDGSKTASCTVTVTRAVTGVSLNKITASLKVGETTTLIATVNPYDATNKNVTWSSSNPLVAEVDSTGKVIAKGKGTATITVTTVDGNITASCEITVVNANGWAQQNSKWYYYKDGKMHTGWLSESKKWYYFDESGVMKTGWVKLSGKWYYFDGSGAMKTGWVKLSGKWYYFDGSGAMASGWKSVGGKWYYFKSGGDMATGWLSLNGKWYYLYSDGSMAANTTIDGYKLGKDGAWIH